MTGHRAVVSLGRALADVECGVAVLALAGRYGRACAAPERCAGSGSAHASARPGTAQTATCRSSRATLHLRLVGLLAGPAPRSALAITPRRSSATTRPTPGAPELRRLRTARALIRQRVRRRRAVAAAVGVALELARDRRRRPPQAPGDSSHCLAARPGERDLLTLGERQATALQVAPRRERTPPQAATQRVPCLRYVPPQRRRRSTRRAAARPERLHRLGVHPVRETTDRQLLRSGTRRRSRTPRGRRRASIAATPRPPGSPPRRPTPTPPATPDDLSDPDYQASVAITARTQGTTTWTSHHARLHARTGTLAANSCAPASARSGERPTRGLARARSRLWIAIVRARQTTALARRPKQASSALFAETPPSWKASARSAPRATTACRFLQERSGRRRFRGPRREARLGRPPPTSSGGGSGAPGLLRAIAARCARQLRLRGGHARA